MSLLAEWHSSDTHSIELYCAITIRALEAEDSSESVIIPITIGSSDILNVDIENQLQKRKKREVLYREGKLKCKSRFLCDHSALL